MIVIGLGVMGSATAWQLARRGLSVLGLDQFEAGHERGSSHGRARVIRRVYGEGEIYMPLLERADALWDGMEAESGRTFLHRTGGLDIGPASSALVSNAAATAQSHGVTHERLSAAGIMARFPALNLPDHYEGIYAPDSGMLLSDAINTWLRETAVADGADLRWQTPVLGWRRDGQAYRAETAAGEFAAHRLVIAAGAWAGCLLPELDHVLAIERQVVAWYDPAAELGDLPVFQVEPEDGIRPYIMPPLSGDGLKIGVYGHLGQRGAEMRDGFPPGADDDAHLRSSLDRWLPGMAGATQLMKECRFTRTYDDRFIIGTLPRDPGVVLLSPCSGHGYKFAPAIGEAAADLVTGEELRIDLTPFSVERVLQ
ncbi:N-methyl-L-tryptophan oxidase [Hyphobacterium marinum]|uniref:N-methyl-L-tryptophan oxidase n=1 Tax=Hyphobacterium marinum TaxID=3116574 RepID=A0ABU7LWQ8_9PROT|nr:N-methyl-L-tryptophan oxidase [Hyphobacterium sp. Y6023]MEE2565630.1 N-methyl-L-tryptophan oxidase [Hyphobacterium sp. Y6023]